MAANNYMTGFQNPMDSFNQAFSMGRAMTPTPVAADAPPSKTPEQVAAEQQAAAQQAAAQKEAMDALMAPGATYEDYMKASMFLPKDAASAMQAGAKGLAEKEAAAALNETGQLFAAFRSGRIDLATNMLKQQAEAERAAGNAQGADYANSLIQIREQSPAGADAVERMVGYSLVALGGKDVFDAIGRMESERRLALEHPTLMKQKEAELAKAKSEAEKAAVEAKYADRMQSADLAAKEADAMKAKLENERAGQVELGEDARTEMNNFVEKAAASTLTSQKAANLAAEFEKQRPAKGWSGAAFEAWKKAAGGQDAMTALKQQYTNLRNLETIKNLPAGPASDKDVEIALAAFPDVNANPDQIAGFLRGMAKLHAYNAEVEYAKAAWVSQNASLGPARYVFEINGTPIKRGMSFKDVVAKIQIPNIAAGGFGAAPAASVPEEVDF